MATSIVLPSDLHMRRWHETQQQQLSQQPCPTSSSFSSSSPPSNLTSSAQPPPPSMATGDAPSHRPRLPSFGDFLSGASHNNLGPFQPAQPSPYHAPSSSIRGDGPPPANGTGVQHHVAQHNAYGPMSERTSMQTPGLPGPYHQLPQVNRPDANPAQYWGYPQSSSLAHDNRGAPFPSPGIGSPGPSIDHGYGRTVMREEVLPGKGPCYIYDDGTFCQKMINGDTVNPKWGTTKAGKPRKRLGQACNTCREKKIKCDPGVPKCAQCQKFGRDCRFDTTPRTSSSRQAGTGSNSSTYSPSRSSPPEVQQDAQSFRRESNASTDWAGVGLKNVRRSSMALESLLSPATEDGVAADDDSSEILPPAKRARISMSPRPGSEPESLSMGTLMSTIVSPTTVSRFSSATDPTEIDRSLTLHYVAKYFAYVESATYGTLPTKDFTRWVKECPSKSGADRMLLYAMMAMGSVFVRRPEAESHRVIFAKIAEEASRNNADELTLQLLQTRLILALLAFSQGQYNKAWDLCGSALRTAFGLKYNTEVGVRAVAETGATEFGLDYDTLVECRRRTFWSAYVMDCFDGCCSATIAHLFRSQCHIRLPCGRTAYEAGNILATPFELGGCGGNNVQHQQQQQQHGAGDVSRVGLLGYLVEIATIFHDVVDKTSRLSPDNPERYAAEMEHFYHHTKARLCAWEDQVRTMSQGSRNGDEVVDSVHGLHIMYHYTAITLHRYVHHAALEPKAVTERITACHDHAEAMLRTVQRLSNHEERDPYFRFATTSPFNGFAITAALDVITAAGTLSDLMDSQSRTMSLVSSGLEALESLVGFWHSAHRQREMVKKRLGTLMSAMKMASHMAGAYYFGESMESPFRPEQDVVYGVGRERYFQAWGWSGRFNESDFHRLD
ncbi:uncharacterized protein PV06_08968 [Exophiala oligosperma]|uniref:Zn(2)-C6 fungal-type domain-containing protein n=1 Tax=Exophiala oligosperma TaxID=215243 RepID=A0A0D2BNS6_9EURO|nr:uncharacterized protein PV06_08968 [Exophiala oligosperma]KIW39167.1 hypothetical protein PV06_08968 [Exophiala oligosperma]